jgi:Putative Actinobacterial Holin-X, holin superfamily III
MTLPPPERGAAVTVNGHGRSDGQARLVGLDPAHGGPLPQATLIELIGRLINDVSDLADRQIDLAKQEIGEAKDEAIGAIKRAGIGAGLAAAAGLLLIIWAWTAFIWFFNWVGALVHVPVPVVGEQIIGLGAGAIIGAAGFGYVGMALKPGAGMIIGGIAGLIVGALIGGIAGLGWLLGMLVPGAVGAVAYRFIRGAISEAMSIWPPLPRTRETLKEDLEWVKHLRTPSAK